MTPQLYEQREPRDVPLDPRRCSWAIYVNSAPHGEHNTVRQCAFWTRVTIDGHGYCHRHAKMIGRD